jgi:hypothetical protein
MYKSRQELAEMSLERLEAYTPEALEVLARSRQQAVSTESEIPQETQTHLPETNTAETADSPRSKPSASERNQSAQQDEIAPDTRAKRYLDKMISKAPTGSLLETERAGAGRGVDNTITRGSVNSSFHQVDNAKRQLMSSRYGRDTQTLQSLANYMDPEDKVQQGADTWERLACSMTGVGRPGFLDMARAVGQAGVQVKVAKGALRDAKTSLKEAEHIAGYTYSNAHTLDRMRDFEQRFRFLSPVTEQSNPPESPKPLRGGNRARQLMQDSGIITPEEAAKSANRNSEDDKLLAAMTKGIASDSEPKGTSADDAMLAAALQKRKASSVVEEQIRKYIDTQAEKVNEAVDIIETGDHVRGGKFVGKEVAGSVIGNAGNAVAPIIGGVAANKAAEKLGVQEAAGDVGVQIGELVSDVDGFLSGESTGQEDKSETSNAQALKNVQRINRAMQAKGAGKYESDFVGAEVEADLVSDFEASLVPDAEAQLNKFSAESGVGSLQIPVGPDSAEVDAEYV